MNEFKDKLKLQNITFTVSAVALAVTSIIAILGECGYIPYFTPVTGDSHWDSRWRGFITGASFGTFIFMIVGLIRNFRAMRDEKAMKKLYIKENDERTAEIVKSAQAAAYRTTLSVGLVAVIITGYFNISVSLTILCCVWFTVILGPAYKFYFSRKL